MSKYIATQEIQFAGETINAGDVVKKPTRRMFELGLVIEESSDTEAEVAEVEKVELLTEVSDSSLFVEVVETPSKKKGKQKGKK